MGREAEPAAQCFSAPRSLRFADAGAGELDHATAVFFHPTHPASAVCPEAGEQRRLSGGMLSAVAGRNGLRGARRSDGP